MAVIEKTKREHVTNPLKPEKPPEVVTRTTTEVIPDSSTTPAIVRKTDAENSVM